VVAFTWDTMQLTEQGDAARPVRSLMRGAGADKTHRRHPDGLEQTIEAFTFQPETARRIKARGPPCTDITSHCVRTSETACEYKCGYSRRVFNVVLAHPNHDSAKYKHAHQNEPRLCGKGLQGCTIHDAPVERFLFRACLGGLKAAGNRN
jgi:hypothetical protein